MYISLNIFSLSLNSNQDHIFFNQSSTFADLPLQMKRSLGTLDIPCYAQ